MSAAITPETQAPGAQSSGLKAVPLAVWGLVGVLALASAGLTGALVSRSIDTDSSTAPAAVQAAAQQAPVQAPTQQFAAPQQTQAPVVQQAQPAPAKVARPAPQRAPVQAQPAPTVVAQAPAYAPAPMPVQTQRAAVCATCGTVESVQAIQVKGEGSGLGVAGGAVVGGLLGNQVGGGNGKTAMTVLGAIGGGLAGNEVEKRVRASTSYDVTVRMEDGSTRTFRRAEPLGVGTRVQADGNGLRVSGGGSAPAPRQIYTVAPSGT